MPHPERRFRRSRPHPVATALIALALAGCAGSGVCKAEEAAPLAVADADGTLRCEGGRYLSSDLLGGPDAPGPREQMGDLRCYDACTSDADCRDPCLPHCSVQGLFNGGDFSCNATIRLCRAKAEDDCAVERPL